MAMWVDNHNLKENADGRKNIICIRVTDADNDPSSQTAISTFVPYTEEIELLGAYIQHDMTKHANTTKGLLCITSPKYGQYYKNVFVIGAAMWNILRSRCQSLKINMFQFLQFSL